MMRYCMVCGVPIKRGERCRPHAYERKKSKTVQFHKKWYFKPGPKMERMERNCLKCGRRFLAQGRFNRKCDSCKRADADMIDWGSIAGVIR